MSEKQKYYITTAIAYTSGKPHIGNTYEIVLADAIARYLPFSFCPDDHQAVTRFQKVTGIYLP